LRTGRNSNRTPSDFSAAAASGRGARLISALAVAELREITSAAATMARKPSTATVKTTISADEKSIEPSFEESRTTNGVTTLAPVARTFVMLYAGAATAASVLSRFSRKSIGLMSAMANPQTVTWYLLGVP